MYNAILEVLKSLNDDAIVSMWNEYCYNTNNYDDEILDAYGLEEWAKNDDVINVLNRFFFGADEGNYEVSANPNRNYFQFNGYANVVSFDYIYNSYTEEFSYIDIDELIDYIIENKEDFGRPDLEEVFEDFEED